MSSNIFEFVRYFVILNKKINIFKKQHPDFHLGLMLIALKLVISKVTIKSIPIIR